MARDEDNGFDDWGGYFEAKKLKLEEQFAAASNPFRKSTLFENISIFVNGLTNPSADELKRIMMVHGGTYHHYERSHTNFIIASNLPDFKVRKMNTNRILSAQWVVDCVQQMRVLDYKPYLLYTNQKTTQPRLNFGKGKDKDDSTVAEPETVTNALENQLGGILKELQQAVATSPEQKNSSKLNNISANNNSHSARTAVDPAFLSEFYKNSRLHHIATLGSGFKQYVCELRQAHGNGTFKKRAELREALPRDVAYTSGKRYVMHIDMDCFFVSVGLRNHPELRGLPIAVTHSKGGSAATDVPVHPQSDRQLEKELFAQRFEHVMHDNNLVDKVRGGFEKKSSLSEIASCSYEARQKGIKNGMFVGQALKLCPELKTIPYDFEGYREVAYALYNAVAQYTLNIEAVSCDEMFVELTELIDDLQSNVMSFVTHLRQEVWSKTGCPCSAGVGENKLLARMATKQAKPNGQHLLAVADVSQYMSTLALEVLPGVGSSMSYKLNQAGLNTCGDVQQVSLVRLELLLGKKMALTLYQNCRGIDTRALNYEQQRKSVSAEVNYGIRFTQAQELDTFLRQLCTEVHNRLLEIKRKAKTITLKLMVRAADAPVETSKFMGHGVCDTQTKSVQLPQGTSDVTVITQSVLKMMMEMEVPPHELRGLGVHLSKLDELEVKKENVLKNMFSKISEKQKNKPKEQREEPVEDKKQIEEPKRKSPRVSVFNMLKQAADKKQSTKSKQRKEEQQSSEQLQHEMSEQQLETKSKPMLPASLAQFDADVLAQLPEEIRREILNEPEAYLRLTAADKHESEPKRKRKMKRIATAPRSRSSTPPPPPPRMRKSTLEHSPLNESDLQPSTSKDALEKQLKRACRVDQIVIDYAQQLPRHMHPVILEHLKSNDVIPKSARAASPAAPDNIFLDDNYKTMLASWVKSTEIPQQADVNLMYMNISLLVEDNRMNDVYDIMKYLCRLIKSKRRNCCRWHMAYNEIESNIQEKVQEELDVNIYFTEAIDCYKCT
ncbi:Rev1 [Drosophila busckii]|uniref:DNA repair protein REV1 n=1 Tax=Drosophila busckii TaxID=30019 RepID=A0A0M4E8N8_DROBS|nr:DNA repair protein REV1 [Drosophila busckii]ALC43278.1 Rev1 [Drosophila busckii]